MATEIASISTPAMAITAKKVNILLTLLLSGEDGAAVAGEPISCFTRSPSGYIRSSYGRGKV